MCACVSSRHHYHSSSRMSTQRELASHLTSFLFFFFAPCRSCNGIPETTPAFRLSHFQRTYRAYNHTHTTQTPQTHACAHTHTHTHRSCLPAYTHPPKQCLLNQNWDKRKYSEHKTGFQNKTMISGRVGSAVFSLFETNQGSECDKVA